MCKPFQSLLGVILVISCVSAFAEPIPGRWEKMEALAVGTEILVLWDGGDRLLCRYKSIGPDSLLVGTEEGKEQSIPKSAVKKIETVSKHVKDPRSDGAAVGGVIGVLLGGFQVLMVVGSAGSKAAAVVGVAAMGAGIGYAIDAGHELREDLYKAE